MGRYDFTRFNTDSFEELVSAIAFKVFGPGGMTFSKGPDGGRDFTFEGEPSAYHDKKWSGYVVLQAKCKDRLEGGRKDVDWLINELKKELKSFKDKNSGRIAPKYYIIASNVSLSGADGKDRKGGVTKITECLNEWKKEIGLVDFDIWHSNKLKSFLDVEPEIRRAYTCWFTPSDVLSGILEDRSEHERDVEAALKTHLAHSLKQDQYVRLRDAGAADDNKTRTGQVFVDIPGRYRSDSHHKPANLIGTIARWSKIRMDPSGQARTDQSDTPFAHSAKPWRQVILGGPGQGKTTTCLFLIQLFRALSLKGTALFNADADLQDTVSEIINRARSEEIPVDLPLRFPAHIDLPTYADQITQARLSGQKIPTLIEYISSQISTSSDQYVTPEHINRLLRAMSWIVVLDGLDEVPPSGERASIVDAIDKFDNFIIQNDCDLLLIVTSRPQGYNQDLSVKKWRHWSLVDLDKPASERYLRALAMSQYPDNPSRRDSVLKELQRASAQSATANLMLSPLQNCIMFMIVDIGRTVPADRWSLFQAYYDILEKREKAKKGPVGEIVERNQTVLEQIHARVGLILQIKSERSGAASAYLSHSDFRKFLRLYLSKTQGFQNEKLESRIEEIFGIAIHRLVLLSTQLEDKISFDVRSLQEFMAAKALMSGDPTHVELRLTEIADKAHWSHTFLIAANGCFADSQREYFRTNIISIPRVLETREEHRCISNGAFLAKKMFTDGVAYDADLYRRLLVKHSLEYLRVCSLSELDEMIELRQPEMEEVFDEVLSGLSSSIDTHEGVSSWALKMNNFDDLGSGEKQEFSRRFDRLSRVKRTKILTHNNAALRSSFGISRLASVAKDMGPKEALAKLSNLARVAFLRQKNDREGRDQLLSPIQDLKLLLRDAGNQFIIKFAGASEGYDLVNFRLHPISSYSIGVTHGGIAEGQKWAFLNLVWAFSSNPTNETLLTVLRSIDSVANLNRLKSVRFILPWPVEMLIDSCNSLQKVSNTIEQFMRGELGTVDNYLEAEARWRGEGVTKEDLKFTWNQEKILHQDIATIGIPPFEWDIQPGDTLHFVMIDIWKMIRGAPKNLLYKKFCNILGVGLGRHTQDFILDGKTSEELLHMMHEVANQGFAHRAIFLESLAYFDPSVFVSKKNSNKIRQLLKKSKIPKDQREAPVFVSKMKDIYKDVSFKSEALLLVCIFGGKDDVHDLCSQGTEVILSPVTDKTEVAGLSRIIYHIYATEMNEGTINFVIGELRDLNVDAGCLNLVLHAIERNSLDFKENVVVFELRIQFLSEIVSIYSKKDYELFKLTIDALRETLNMMHSNLSDPALWFEKYALPEDCYDFVQIAQE